MEVYDMLKQSKITEIKLSRQHQESEIQKSQQFGNKINVNDVNPLYVICEGTNNFKK